jgi:hypothetical protein
MSRTRIAMTITTSEYAEYEFDGRLTEAECLERLGEGDHQPTVSDIKSEDIHVYRVEVLP